MLGTLSKMNRVESELVRPSIEGNICVLRAAYKVPSVKRIVFTSSASAVIPWFTGPNFDSKSTFDCELPFLKSFTERMA